MKDEPTFNLGRDLEKILDEFAPEQSSIPISEIEEEIKAAELLIDQILKSIAENPEFMKSIQDLHDIPGFKPIVVDFLKGIVSVVQDGDITLSMDKKNLINEIGYSFVTTIAWMVRRSVGGL